MGNIVTINFNGDQLLGFEDSRGTFVALKPIIDGMGLDWPSQHKRLKRDSILGEGMVVMTIPSEGGPQESSCLSLDLVHGWLFTIDASRVRPSIRDRVRIYQRECYRVLADAFRKPSRITEPTPPMPIETSGQDHARKLVTEARHSFGELASRQLWFRLGLPTVPAMYGGAVQLPLFTYDAHPRQPGGN